MKENLVEPIKENMLKNKWIQYSLCSLLIGSLSFISTEKVEAVEEGLTTSSITANFVKKNMQSEKNPQNKAEKDYRTEKQKNDDRVDNLKYMLGVPKEPEAQQKKREAWVKKIQAGLDDEAKEKSKRKTEERRKKVIEEFKAVFPYLEETSAVKRFINTIAVDTVAVADKYKIHPSVMIAQALLESDSGRSDLAATYHNYFGIKGDHGFGTTNMETGEHGSGGGKYYIRANFAIFDSPRGGMDVYGDLMRNGTRYNSTIYSGTWRENAPTYREATAALVGIYATDPNYNYKLNEIIEYYGLDRFDSLESVSEETLNSIRVEVQAAEASVDMPKGYDEVKRGDSLYSIALRNHISVSDLIQWNGWKETELPHEFQWIIVSKDKVGTDIEKAVLKYNGLL